MELLSNEHIRLRALEPEDLDLLYQWENDSALWELGSTVSPYSRYILRDYISRSHLNIYESKQLRLMIEQRETGERTGMVDLYDFDPHNRKAGVGILLDARYRGDGYATEALTLIAGYAFSFLKLHQLYAHIPVANEQSKALFLRCGFSVTGKLSDWISSAEKGFTDVWVMQHIPAKKSF
ncbi:MAG: GNAT family N-acetyltransferase [Bacteroidales bacterium]